MKTFSIFSPTAGLVTDQPSILLPSAATPEIQDMYFGGGEARRYRKRSRLFTSSLEDPIIKQYTLNQASQSRKYNMYFTRRDVAYWDVVRDCFVYVTPRITEGMIQNAVEVSGGLIELTVAMDSLAKPIKAGDFLRLSDASGLMLSSDDWMEVDSVDGNTITVVGVLPSAYSIPSLGDEFCVRSTYTGADSDIWVCDTFAGEAAVETLIATNNGVDYPIRWTGGANESENITELFKCSWLNAFGGRILALNIIANGNLYPTNYRWSELLDETVWEGTLATAGETSLVDGIGAIVMGFVFRDYLYVVRTGSIDRISIGTDTDIFTSRVLRNDLGTYAGNSFVVTRDQVYFFCTQDFTFRRFDGFYDTIISKAQDPTIKDITASKVSLIRGFFANDSRQMIWSVPYAGSETPNVLLIADIENAPSPWTKIEMPVLSFGTYENTVNYDWETLPFTEWASWNWQSWQSRESSIGYAVDTCADENGRVYKMNDSRLDDGEEYESSIVFETDLSGSRSLPMFKRLLKIQTYTRDAGGGTLDIAIKRDLESEWVSAGSISLGGGREINVNVLPVDFRAKTFKVKVSSKYDFQLIGLVFWFQPLGER